MKGIRWQKRGQWARWMRVLAFLNADALLVALSLWLAFLVRFDGVIPPRYVLVLRAALPLAVGVKLSVLALWGAYRFIWRYVSIEDLWNLFWGCVVGSLTFAAALFFLREWTRLAGFPRSILLIDFAFTFLGLGALRFTRRAWAHFQHLWPRQVSGRKALIVGAGEAGEQLVRSLKRDASVPFWPVGFLDDDPAKQGVLLHGVPVLGPRAYLPEIVRKTQAEAVIIAMPSAPARVIRETVELARQSGITDIKIVPPLSELYTGQIRASDVREIRPEDILPREPVSIDMGLVEDFLRGKQVLVTGAAGSIGSELCRQVLRFAPAELWALDIDESGLFMLQQRLQRLFPQAKVHILLADIRDASRMEAVFRETRPQVVFHAAAYKHVPILEHFPQEAVKTNIFGTWHVAEQACRHGAEAFILISTDKAVNPTSVMGMTKRVAEWITLALNQKYSTRCLAVRFGNVLGSRGSVIPLFLEQIRQGGPVTVTHPDMERYFMTISEAVLLVLQAAAMGKGGEIMVLDMGKPVKILDVARELIRFHGLEPDKDIPIVFTGIRPGEKLREDLLTDEEGLEATRHEAIFVVPGKPVYTLKVVMDILQELQTSTMSGTPESVVQVLKSIVHPTLQDQEAHP